MDGQHIVLISAAMTRPLTPQPTTGTHMPGLVGPPPWHSTHMSSPRHTICPVSAQVIITSPLAHPSFLLTVNLASLLQPRPSAFRAQFFTVVAPGGSGPPLAHLFPASVLCSGHTRHRHLRPPPLAGPAWGGLSWDGRLCSGHLSGSLCTFISVRLCVQHESVGGRCSVPFSPLGGPKVMVPSRARGFSSLAPGTEFWRVTGRSSRCHITAGPGLPDGKEAGM